MESQYKNMININKSIEKTYPGSSILKILPDNRYAVIVSMDGKLLFIEIDRKTNKILNSMQLKKF